MIFKASTVNSALRHIDPDAQLVNDSGYWYFSYGIAEFFTVQWVNLSPGLNTMSVAQYVSAFEEKIAALRKYDPADIVGGSHADYVKMRRKRFSKEWPTLGNMLRVKRGAV